MIELSNEGFVDITDQGLKNLNVFFGGRGLGKTYSVLKHRILYAMDHPEGKFIWLRDSMEVVKKISAGNSLALPIEVNEESFPHVEIVKIDGNYCFIANPKTDHAIVLGYLMALSTFHNARGISYEDVSYIIWDEFIPESGTIVKKNQGLTFLNMYESVNRNREFKDQEPVKIIFLSNTNDIYSDVLADLGVSKIIEDMQFNHNDSYEDEDILIMFLSSQTFYEKKKNTFIYRINQNDKFNEMALNNNFLNNTALIKRKVNYKDAVGLLTVNYQYTLIELKNKDLYFKAGSWKDLINYDIDNDQEAVLFRLLFHDKLRLKYIAGKMFFDSIYTQRKILEYARF